MVNNHTFFHFCVKWIGRADIEGSKSNVAMIAWLPQASYPCGNFSDTPNLIIKGLPWIHLAVSGSWEIANPSNLPRVNILGIVRPSFQSCQLYWNWQSNELIPLYSTRGFCPLWVHLWTPALSCNRCAAPAKLPVYLCHSPVSKLNAFR